MLNIWSQNSGYTFGTYQENVPINLPLPIVSGISNVKFQVISGKLPPGLRLENNVIKGTPKEVVRTSTFKFCIRASKSTELADRTFNIIVEGADEPNFITPEGLLPVGENKTFFALDRTPIEFFIQAEDFDTAAGQKLRYFISSGDGELPPGLTLEDDGRLHGLIDPLLAVFVDDRNGGYDTVNYDLYGFDYGIKSDNGFDTFNYDMTTYDYFAPLRVPRKLNRNYEFIVSVNDGDTVKKRKFRIYVVGEDFLKSDNTIIKAGTNLYRADNTDLRKPIWMTSPDLGILRGNNYHIIKLDIYDMIALGQVQYYLEPNIDPADPTSPKSQLPPGMKLDIKSGELFGIIPFQSRSIETYVFTITAVRFGRKAEQAAISRTFTIKILGEIDSSMSWITPADLGVQDANLVCNLNISASSTLANAQIFYNLISGQLPPGLVLEKNGEITGKIRQYTSSGPDFQVGTSDDLKGMTTIYDVSGTTRTNTVFDGGTTTFDKTYKFIVRANDQSGYSSIDREFSISIGTPHNKLFSNMYVTTYMQEYKRDLYINFINNESVFPRDAIYRPDDKNFGVRKDLRVLLFAGIETLVAKEYVSMIGLNHKKKRFRFGEVKSAVAKAPGTNNVVYEVVYIQMIDSQDFKDDKLPLSLTIDDFNRRNLDLKIKMVKANNVISADASNYIWKTAEQDYYVSDKEPFIRRPLEAITVDRSDLQVSDFRSRNRYPNTYTNWRRRIKDWNSGTSGVINEPKYLPLWMRSFQDNRQELGFTLALPLCYCLAGASQQILLNIKNSEFDFKNLDFTVDRYIIDSVTGLGQDSFLVFQNKEVVV